VNAGELGNALQKASSQIGGSDGWYSALGPFVRRTGTNELGKMTVRGFTAVRDEFGELKKQILDQNPPLDVKTELDLAEKELESNSIRDICNFLSRWSRVSVLVGRMNSEGKLQNSVLMFKCDRLEIFVEQHGVRAFLPKEQWETQQSAAPLPPAPQTGQSEGAH